MKNAKLTLPIFGVFALSLIFLVAASCSNDTSTNVNSNIAVANVNEEPVVNENENENENLNENVNETVPTGSETTSLNAVWNSYTNYDLGFSINVPKQISNVSVACELNSSGFYTATNGDASTAVLEDGNNVFITHEIFPDLTNGTEMNSYTTDYRNCLVKNVEVSDLGDDNWIISKWKIIVRNVGSEAELEDFVNDLKSEWDMDCPVRELAESETQAGVYDVVLETTGPEGDCFINGMEVTKYYPDGNKAVHWGIGQDITFSNEGYTENYDQDMVNSFRFL